MQQGIDYIGVGTCAVCHDGQGRIFLNKRGKKCRDEWGKWDNCGGAVRFGESLEECVVRELAEEYGCKPIKCRFGGFVNAIRHISHRKTHWLILAYLVQIDPREAKNNEPEKLEAVGWFPLDGLPEGRHSYFGQDFAAVRAAWEEFYGQESLCSSMDRTAAS